jgi:hypothetical protein
MRVNQAGDPIEEEQVFAYVGDDYKPRSDQDRNDAIALLCDHLKVEIWRTNATKHGDVQLVLRKVK